MERVAENSITRTLVHLITPILLAVIAWLGQRQLNAIETNQADMSKTQQQQASHMGTMASDIRDLNTRFDLAAIKRIDELEVRVKHLEQVTKTP
ncbi:hypothetical protein [Xanthomonas albilineans]|nr:hypothetical protein [Xanthomonas albilineans]